MSNRALRKLHGKKDDIAALASNLNLDEDESEGSGEESNIPVKKENGKANVVKAQNLFSLLGDDDNDVRSDEEDSEVAVQEDRLPSPVSDAAESQGARAKKKKKQKKKKNAREETKEDVLVEDEFPNVTPSDENLTSDTGHKFKDILSIEQKHLNPENELKRIFGSRVIQAEQKRKTRGKARTRTTWLVNPNPQWAHMGRTGLSMSIDRSEDGVYYFKFEHNKDYREIQFKFWDAVSSLDPNNVVALTNMYPFHVDSLLQLSDICRMGEDVQMATELIERSLFVMESALHPSFSFPAGNCRLDYRVQENRAFFLAIFKHLNYVGQRGCYRTALEFSKLLYNLDPENDPLAALLLIDFYALKSEEYSWLVDFYKAYEPSKNLSQLPNFAFTIALAYFHIESGESEGNPTDLADSFLQEALLNFPGTLIPLLDKCSIQADPVVTKHPFFGPKAQISQSPALTSLIRLYVGRSFHLWKVPAVLPWLERNAHAVLKKVKDSSLVSQYEEKRKRRYQGTPRNIYRHVILSEIKDATASLPPDLADAPLMSFDPLPPVDSIVSYTRPRRTRQEAAAANEGFLSSFFQSLLPGYNVGDIINNGQVPLDFAEIDDIGVAELVQQQQEGQAAGAAADLRQSVASLMDAVRNLLHNVYTPAEGNAREESGDSQDED